MRLSLVAVFLAELVAIGCKPSSVSGLRDAVEADGYSEYESSGLVGAEERGRRIWYEACGDNARFHTYVAAQKLGAPQDWYRVLSSKNRGDRWSKWGLIPDPDCRPGDDSSYGFDVCKGDRAEDGIAGPGYEPLLDKVGQTDWKDPGCYISGSFNELDCHLGLGTSTGALGYRKFPNPRFAADRWPGWEKWNPNDASIEPPFLIGTACGSCHITFNPLNPPADPNHPKWGNISGLVGNQYQNISEVIGSGLAANSLEWQVATNSRQGTVDTSVHPTDLIHNPGTVNALINTDRRPPGFPTAFTGPHFKPFDKVVEENGHTETRRVFNILKGGEDDVGGSGAILRVYVNIGTCSEQCWMNHLIDNRSIFGPGSEQTPFSQAQCRRDCPSYQALEARYFEVLQFFITKGGRPTDLKDAMFKAEAPEARYGKLVAALGPDKVKRGRKVYAKNCAQCHSSQEPPQGQTRQQFFDDLAENDSDDDPFLRTNEAGVRLDWLGNEEREPVTKIGTLRCRSLHSNHMAGHIWDEFSSKTYKDSPPPPGIPDLIPELKGWPAGGRGYYRNVSLLSVWASAPFGHNNAIGVELCSELHPRTPCIDKNAVRLDDGRTVNATSVEGRLKLFEDSMHALLNPATRGRKVSRTDLDIVVPLNSGAANASTLSWPVITQLGTLLRAFGADVAAASLEGLSIRIPKGTPVALLASLDYRKLVRGVAGDIAAMPVQDRPRALINALNTIFSNPEALAEVLKRGPANSDPSKYNGYSNCTDVIEDKGHEFGAALSEADKDALITFMKTL